MRDPKRYPREGDVVKPHRAPQRTVIKVDEYGILFHRAPVHDSLGSYHRHSLEEWREACVTATVIHIAGEGEG